MLARRVVSAEEFRCSLIASPHVSGFILVGGLANPFFLNEAESSSLALRLADLPARGFDAPDFPSRRPPAT